MVNGVLAQLVERLVRNEKVRGSNPLGSTKFSARGGAETHLRLWDRRAGDENAV